MIHKVLDVLTGKATHKHEQIWGIVPGLGECQKMFMCLLGSFILSGAARIHKQIPQENSGTIPRRFCLCVCVCFSSVAFSLQSLGNSSSCQSRPNPTKNAASKKVHFQIIAPSTLIITICTVFFSVQAGPENPFFLLVAFFAGSGGF